MKNQKGFTLIEVIVSFIMIGVLMAIAGFAFSKITAGYAQAKENSEDTQKIQVAMARIAKEFDMITGISAITATSITYTITGNITNTFALSGSTVQITGINPVIPSATLINNVTAFTLGYYDAAGAVTAVPTNIRQIGLNFTITGADNVPLSFMDTIAIMESYV